MIVFPNAKINLGLHILERRQDGYHNLETLFYPIQVSDALEVVRSADAETRIRVTGIALDDAENICLKAYYLLKKQHQLPPVEIFLHKAIPSGAGLGGGSADGAFMLELLNAKFDLGLSKAELGKLALDLGSDCPFFIANQPSLATGRGEILKQVSLDLSRFFITVIYPGIHVSTSSAFRNIRYRKHGKQIEELISMPVDTWKENLGNDFEDSVFGQYPAVGNVKEQLYRYGAVYASMSGSGSAVYGIFEQAPPQMSFPNTYSIFQLPGRS